MLFRAPPIAHIRHLSLTVTPATSGGDPPWRRRYGTTALPAVVALLDGERAGVATYRIIGRECELVTLDSVRDGAGVGTALVDAVAQAARAAAAG